MPVRESYELEHNDDSEPFRRTVSREPSIVLGLNAVIVAVTKESPRILTLSGTAEGPRRSDPLGDRFVDDVLPYGPLDPEGDRTLELTLRGWVEEQTGLELGYVEQLYTFGDRDRAPGPRSTGPRVVSVAYLALVREDRPAGETRAGWRDWYTFFPWEDRRAGTQPVVDDVIAPQLEQWVRSAPAGPIREERVERAGITFGLGGSGWDSDRVLERYELLYEVGLVEEAHRDQGSDASRPDRVSLGRPMGADHRRILATGLGRIRGKIRYRPVVFELVPDSFTLLRLQRVVEALAGLRLHKQNFRRLVERGGLVEGTGTYDLKTGGRPAELFRFRREVLRERRAPGVGLPGVRSH